MLGGIGVGVPIRLFQLDVTARALSRFQVAVRAFGVVKKVGALALKENLFGIKSFGSAGVAGVGHI